MKNYTAKVSNTYNDDWYPRERFRGERVEDFPLFDGKEVEFDTLAELAEGLSKVIGVPAGVLDVYPVNYGGDGGVLYCTFVGDENAKESDNPDNIFDVVMEVTKGGRVLSYDEIAEIK